MANDITFTPGQLQYLESIFPNAVLGPDVTEARLRYHCGQQSVLLRIKEKTRGLANTIQVIDRDLPQKR